MHASPSCSLVTQAASRTLTVNQPSDSATSPCSLLAIRASSMAGRLRAVIRAAELLCALSLATDLGSAQPLEHGLKVCSTALSLAEAAGIEPVEDVYCAALLHAIGCTSDAYEAARLYGDDRAVRAGYATVDGARPAEVVAFLARHAGAGRALPGRAVAFAAALAAGPRQARAGFAAHCEVGVRLAERLGLPEAAQAALGFVFERWDGKGYPAGAAGQAIPLVARVLHVARDAVVFAGVDGPDAACETIAARAGTAYDPELAAAVTPAMIGGAPLTPVPTASP